MLSWFFKCELVDHRVKIVTDLSKFDPSGRTHHFIGDEGFTACKEEQRLQNHTLGIPLIVRNVKIVTRSTDLDAFPGTGRLVTAFHSLPYAICRWRPHTHSLQPERLHHPPRPSVCTLFHCHPTTYNWCHPGRKVADQPLKVTKWCDVALGNSWEERGG